MDFKGYCFNIIQTLITNPTSSSSSSFALKRVFAALCHIYMSFCPSYSTLARHIFRNGFVYPLLSLFTRPDCCLFPLEGKTWSWFSYGSQLWCKQSAIIDRYIIQTKWYIFATSPSPQQIWQLLDGLSIWAVKLRRSLMLSIKSDDIFLSRLYITLSMRMFIKVVTATYVYWKLKVKNQVILPLHVCDDLI